RNVLAGPGVAVDNRAADNLVPLNDVLSGASSAHAHGTHVAYALLLPQLALPHRAAVRHQMQRVLSFTAAEILGNPHMVLVQPPAVNDVALPRTLRNAVAVLRILGCEFVPRYVIHHQREPGVAAVHLLDVRVHPYTHRIPHTLNAQPYIKPVLLLILRVDAPPAYAT